MTRWANALVGASLVGVSALAAQQPVTPASAATTVRVTLAEALEQARKNSPTYLQTLNDAGPAGWSVRNAYAALLPTFDVGGSMGYTGSGRSTFGGTTFSQNSPSLSSSYSLSFNWRLSGDVLTNTGTQKANRRAVDADISNAIEVRRCSLFFPLLIAIE